MKLLTGGFLLLRSSMYRFRRSASVKILFTAMALVVSSPHDASAQFLLACSDVFTTPGKMKFENPMHPPLPSLAGVPVPNLMASPSEPASSETIHRVTMLAKQLITANAAVVSSGETSFIRGATEFTRIELTYEIMAIGPSRYATYVFQGTGINKDGTQTYFTHLVRSNGQVAFLNSTWRFRERSNSVPKAFNIVYFDGDEIKIADQANAILQTLPEDVTISRTMGENEMNFWLSGRSNFESKLYGARLHFFPDRSRFKPEIEPVFLTMPREKLLEFYRRHELEINIYEEDRGVELQMDLTHVPLGVEFVFSGKAGIEQIAPYLKEQILESNSK